MSPRILVTGGTGTLGSLVVPMLRDAGARVRVLSRHAAPPAEAEAAAAAATATATDAAAEAAAEAAGALEYSAVDLVAGGGLDAALAGVETVLHLAGGPRDDDVATRNLVEAARRAGTVRHLVLISVIGADQMPIGYFRRKLASEWALADSGIGWTVLRAAQFHSLTLATARGLAKLPLLLAPGGVRWQPVDPRDVAERLAELALGTPAGLVPDLAGPRTYTLDEIGRGYLRAVGKRRARLPIHVPGKTGRLYRAGANLAHDGQTGTRSWEDYLAEHAASQA